MFYSIGLMCFEECAHECCSLELAIGKERQTQRERERYCVWEREIWSWIFGARALCIGRLVGRVCTACAAVLLLFLFFWFLPALGCCHHLLPFIALKQLNLSQGLQIGLCTCADCAPDLRRTCEFFYAWNWELCLGWLLVGFAADV